MKAPATFRKRNKLELNEYHQLVPHTKKKANDRKKLRDLDRFFAKLKNDVR
jgi:hypothetical protein